MNFFKPGVDQDSKCYACGKKFRRKDNDGIALVLTEDGFKVFVGPDCHRIIKEQANYAKQNNIENPGYMHKSGGPALFPLSD